jgi:putative protein-disulfide isomerase
MNTRLYYLHDPMCSWCWGYRFVWDKLQQNLPTSIVVEYVAGGLAPDSDEPMPISQQRMIQNHWRTIEQKLGTAFNHDFWHENTPRRSTYNACRAAIAADKQSCQKPMIDAIQRAYYLRALNPSDLTVIIGLAEELSQYKSLGLNLEQFITDIGAVDTDKELVRQIGLAKKLSQYGFPSLVLKLDSKYQQVPIDYSDYELTLNYIKQKMS